MGVPRPVGPTNGVEPAGAGLRMGMGMAVPGGITGCPGGGGSSGSGMRIEGCGEIICGMTGGPGPAGGGPGMTAGGGAGCGSGIPMAGAMNSRGMAFAAAAIEGMGNWSRGRRLKNPPRSLRCRLLPYVAGCGCGCGCGIDVLLPLRSQESYRALGSCERSGRKGEFARTSFGPRGRGLCSRLERCSRRCRT